LCGTLGDTDGFPELSIAYLNCPVATLLLLHQPKVDKEAGGSAIMCDQVAHQDVNNIII
jgi:hypothetical protein